MVQHRNPQFVRVFIFEHNLERYSTNLFQHRQPFWYFIPVVLIAILPWVVFAIAALVRAIRESIQTRSSFELFFALWAIVPVVFFSFSQSKLPGYILPAIPAFAILTAEYLWRRVEEGNEPSLWLAALHALVGGGLIGSALLTVFFVYRIPITPEAAFYSIAAGVVIFAVILVAIYAKGLRTARFVTLAPVVLALAFVIRWATPAIDAKNSERPVAQEISRLVTPGTPVAVDNVSRVVEYGLNFYLNRPIFSYQRGEVPMMQHLVVGRPHAGEAISAAANGRKVLDLGGFPSQNLEFYMVTER
jgi:4-amino-4-deoxy-L-arabinose transferase-like glycosyltransferase